MAETKTTIPVEIKMGNAGTNDANLPAFKEGSIIFTKDTKKIYIMRWDILKQHYMEGRDMQKVHYNAFGEKVQKTYAKLLPLDKIREFGGLYWEVSFDEYNNPLTINNVSVA